MEQVVPQVVEITEHDLYGGDIKEITNMMEEIVNQVHTEVLAIDDPKVKQNKTKTINKVSPLYVIVIVNVFFPQ